MVVDSETVPDTLFDVFGDESCTKEVVTFAIAVVPSSRADALEQGLACLKESKGQSAEADLHCRVLFNGSARLRSSWRALSIEAVFLLYEEFADLLKNNGVTTLCVFADRSRLPARIPGGPWKTRSGLWTPGRSPDVVLGEKQLAGLCGNATQLPLKEFPGLDKVRFWADPDRTQIEWLGRRSQASNTLSMLMGSETGVARVSPQEVQRAKPVLLQVADFAAYFFSRSKSRKLDANRSRFRGGVAALSPFVGELKLGGDGGLGVSMPTRDIASHLRKVVVSQAP